MAKLCPRGKAAAKRKFKVYPSAYANMYASAVCSGKVTPGGKKNRKKAMGGGMMNKRMGLKFGGPKPLETKMIEKKADQTKNVKKLMTQPDAFDPETRFIKGTKKTAGGSTNFIRRTTDQVDLREAVKKAKEDNPGFRVSVMKPEDMPRRERIGSSNKQATKKRQLILNQIDRPKTRKNRAGGGMMNRPMYGKGGGVCIKGMNRQAVGKNS